MPNPRIDIETIPDRVDFWRDPMSAEYRIAARRCVVGFVPARGKWSEDEMIARAAWKIGMSGRGYVDRVCRFRIVSRPEAPIRRTFRAAHKARIRRPTKTFS